ncbi:MAG: Rrf2 family transcriptional regulator, partial [Betaproteobacteria bacterium]|nr:Rrf2 family transcriptional regulator [Betaproteobacteria bacterium]
AHLLGAVRGVGGGYRFAGNARRLTLMDVIELFEDISAPPSPVPRRARKRVSRKSVVAGAAPHEVEQALGVVLEEIDEIAKATFRSITLETMLKLIGRRRSGRA